MGVLRSTLDRTPPPAALALFSLATCLLQAVDVGRHSKHPAASTSERVAVDMCSLVLCLIPTRNRGLSKFLRTISFVRVISPPSWKTGIIYVKGTTNISIMQL